MTFSSVWAWVRSRWWQTILAAMSLGIAVAGWRWIRGRRTTTPGLGYLTAEDIAVAREELDHGHTQAIDWIDAQHDAALAEWDDWVRSHCSPSRPTADHH